MKGIAKHRYAFFITRPTGAQQGGKKWKRKELERQ